MDWIKVTRHYLEDPRFGALPEVVQARFFKLYILAGIWEQDGVIPHSEEEIAWLLHITTEEMQDTVTRLTKVGLYLNNGKGPELPFYLNEQISIEALTKLRDGGKKRSADFRGKHNAVSNNDVTPLPARESRVKSLESRDKSQESEESPSVNQSVSPPGLLDGLTEFSKSDLVSWAGIPKTDKKNPLISRTIVQDDQLTCADILSELTHCYDLKAKKGKIRNAPHCAGLNLLQHQAIPAEYYDRDMWTRHLPSALQTKLGLFIQGAEEESKPVEYSGYTNLTDEEEITTPEAIAWHEALGLLWQDKPALLRKKWLDGTQGISFENGVFTVRAKDQAACEILTSRLGSSMENYLKGILDQDVTVRFVAPGDISQEEIPHEN